MSSQIIFKFVLCLFLICSGQAHEIKKATKLEKEVFAELSQYGHVIMDSINPEEFSKANKSNLALRENVDYILIAYVIIKAVCYLYKGIVALFGHTVSTKFTDVPMDKGYASLAQKVFITYMSGARPGEDCKNIPRVISSLAKLAKIKEGSSDYKAFVRAFEHAKYADVKSWGKKSFFFASTESGKVNYISVMISKYDDDDYVPGPDNGVDEPLCTSHEKYYILFLFLDAAFTLNGDIRITTTEEHWGIWKDRTTSTIETLPRGIEVSDVEQLFKFFNLVGLKALKDKYEVDAPEVEIKVEGQ